MAITRVDFALTTGLNDGTSWANAYQGIAGLVTAVGAAGDGDDIYTRDVQSASVATANPRYFNGLSGLANPPRIIAVRTDAAETPVKGDVILGHREGDVTRAYDQTGAEAPPSFENTHATNDLEINGALYLYGQTFKVQDNLLICDFEGNPQNMTFEECKLIVPGNNDYVSMGSTHGEQNPVTLVFRHCSFDTGAGLLRFVGNVRVQFLYCIFSGSTVAPIIGFEFHGIADFIGCDLSGYNATLVNRIAIHGGTFNFKNCKMPANHILATGTATGAYTIANYGSEDSTGLTSGSSEQELEIETLQGTVDIETTKVRTGGASDGATGGFSWALTISASNVSDNFVALVSPWMYTWVEGDGTAKTLTVFIANDDAESAGNLLQDDEISLEVGFPSEAGISMYDYLPDEGAPGDGGGRMQLLGTAANIATDGSTWGTGGNNKQKLTQSIAPDYQGPLYCRVHFSKSATPPVLYIDPLPEIT